MNKSVICLLAAAFAGIGISSVRAGPGMDSLQYFFDQVDTFEALFTQVVLDESLDSIDDGKGKVWIKRPGLFRWDYDPPDAQKIVGDGEKIWIYDIELEQVTVRSQTRALSRTPAILLAGGGDLERDYTIIDIGTQGKYDWINLVPVDEESGFTEVRIGFEDNHLRLMELLDNLGQRTRMSFASLKENQPVPDSAFIFVPPAGVDVIDESE
jgi:outer membrane lipoprotein carrier protein